MPTFASLESEYVTLWSRLSIRPDWAARIDRAARAILANKRRYQAVERQAGTPWYVIGVIHSLEAGLSFAGHLHNGDSLSGFTHQVPAGRPKVGHGPPFTWEESAVDALKMKGHDKVADWSIARIAYALEEYNGWGYRGKGVHSAYLWSGSTHYRAGKYVADHVWSASAVSKQCGAMCLIRRLTELDTSITFGRTAPPPPDVEPVAAPDKAPAIGPEGKAAIGLGAVLLGFGGWFFDHWLATLLVASIAGATALAVRHRHGIAAFAAGLRASSVWSSIRMRLKGWRTVAIAGAGAALGLADVVGAVDLRPLVEALVPERSVGAVMTGMAIVFGVLRFVTTTAVGGKEKA